MSFANGLDVTGATRFVMARLVRTNAGVTAGIAAVADFTAGGTVDAGLRCVIHACGVAARAQKRNGQCNQYKAHVLTVPDDTSQNKASPLSFPD
jgi:hypothetical protein